MTDADAKMGYELLDEAVKCPKCGSMMELCEDEARPWAEFWECTMCGFKVIS